MFSLDTSISADFRPVPFWSWNDKLEPDELRWQIQEMHKAGLGGFFMHARGGLQTEYLSPEWFECVNVCLDEAVKQGMNAWIYDENGWPSGFGGGIVNAMGPEFQQKYLRFEVLDAAEAIGRENTIAFYSEDGLDFLGKAATGITGKIMRAYYQLNPYYVDNMDAKVVKEFIRVTHQRYYDTLPAGLLKHLRGVFTDEPQLSRNSLLWSFIIEDEYQKEYGLDLLVELPALAYDSIPGHEAVRIRFWKLCGKLFSKNFLKQINDWCEEHNWTLTGHHVLEERCEWLNSNGSVMAQYQHYGIPGIDHLGRGLPSTIMMNQLASVGAQFNHKRLLTESFACTGWNCNFTGQRWIYNTQLAHGMNLLCQHLEGYTLRGQRKRDYPASAYYQEPWWDDYKMQNDSFSRIGQMLANGEHIVDTIVLHPISSAWTLYNGSPEGCYPSIGKLCTEELNNISQALDNRLIDHHYADEILTEDYGSVQDGKLVIGNQSYTIVVVPPLLNISRKIFNMLKAFASQGGTLLRYGDCNSLLIDGIPACPAELAWLQSVMSFADAENAADFVASAHPNRVIATENGKPAMELSGTSRIVKSTAGKDSVLYFFASRKYQEESPLHFSLPATGRNVVCVDPSTGCLTLLDDVTIRNGRIEFDYPLAGADCVLLAVTSEECALGTFNRTAFFPKDTVKKLDGPFYLTKHSENILTIDKCLYSVDGGEFTEADTISIHSRLLNLKRNLDLTMKFSFRISEDFDLKTPLTLVAEIPERLSIALNGIAVSNKDCGYFFDKSFRRLPLPSEALKHGENELVIKMRYTQPDAVFDNVDKARKFETEYNKMSFDSEVESIYIIGDFTVKFDGSAEDQPHDAERLLGDMMIGPALSNTQAIDTSDIVRQGFPFFSGSATFTTQFTLTLDEAKKIKVLSFDTLGANTWKLRINGCEEYLKEAWGPYAFYVKNRFVPGVNTIEIEFDTSLRNMLGPHHQVEAEPYGIWTLSWSREPNFAGYEAPQTTDGFCFVKNGFTNIRLS